MSCWPFCWIDLISKSLLDSTICLQLDSCSNSRFLKNPPCLSWLLDFPEEDFSDFFDFRFSWFGFPDSAGLARQIQHVWSCSKVTNWAANLDLGAPIRSKLNNTQRKLVLLSLRGAESSSDKFGQERQIGLCPTISIFSSISRINSWIRLIEQNVKVLILVFFSQYQQLTDSSVQRQAMTSLDKTIFSK